MAPHPELRVNKLGHTVTKHVRSQQATSSLSMIPAPLPGNQQPLSRAQIIDGIMHDLAQGGAWGSLRNDDLRKRINTLSDSTLEIAHATTEWSRQRTMTVEDLIDIAIMFTDEPQTREALFYRPLIDADGADPVLILGAITGLHWVDRFRRYERLEDLTGHDRDTAVAFINVTIALHQHTDREQLDPTPRNGIAGAVLVDLELHDIITETPDKSDQIIEFIAERKNADPEALREYFRNDTALREGSL